MLKNRNFLKVPNYHRSDGPSEGLVYDPESGLTRQEFLEASMINSIIAKYRRTGIMESDARSAMSYEETVDLSRQESLMEASNQYFASLAETEPVGSTPDFLVPARQDGRQSAEANPAAQNEKTEKNEGNNNESPSTPK